MTQHLDFQRVQGICFDLDGTLVDTDDAYVNRLTKTLSSFRSIPTRENPQDLARKIVMAGEGPTNRALWLIDFLHLDEVLRPLLQGLHYLRGETPSTDIELISGVRPFLDSLSKNFPLAIVTAREQASTYDILHHHQIEPYFQAVVTAGSCRRTKPSPAPMQYAAQLLGIPVESCLMVGDTTVDIRSGRSAGALTVGVLCGFGQREELNRAGANYIIDNTPDLETLLRSNHP